MDRSELIALWRREEQEPFRGWDFSHLDGRTQQDPEPWSFPTRAAELLARSSAVLDMDTGGGERLLGLRQHWPKTMVATEAYPPNVALARMRLGPLGVEVVEAATDTGERLPFADGRFDLILNRHGAFDAGELARVLATGGTFLTQQVHGRNLHDLLAAFSGTSSDPGGSPERYVPQLEAAGLRMLDVRDWTGATTFAEVGAIVYFLKAIPWVVPGFSVDSHIEQLLALRAQVERGHALAFRIRRYLIEAQKRGIADRR